MTYILIDKNGDTIGMASVARKLFALVPAAVVWFKDPTTKNWAGAEETKVSGVLNTNYLIKEV